VFSDQIALLARDREAASQVRELVARCFPFHEIRTVDTGESGWLEDFRKSLQAAAPYAILVEVRGFQEIAEVLDPVRQAAPMTPLLIFCRRIDNNAYLELHRIGLGDRILHLPFDLDSLKRMMAGLYQRHAAPAPPPPRLAPVLSFVPAKPGSGASTLAWHFANVASSLLNAKVALIDLDLNCGVQGLFASVQSGMNLFDAISIVDHAGTLPAEGHIPGFRSVHLFAALRRCRAVRIESSLFGNFLQALRRDYALVVADHSGNWERFSVEAMQASHTVFCITGSDYLSLTQANLARALMEDAGILPSVKLVLNRHSSRFALPPEECERMAGLKLAALLPNCFGELQQAIPNHHLAGGNSRYFAAVEDLALRTLRQAGTLEEDEERRLPARTGRTGWLSSLGLVRRGKPSLAAPLSSGMD
jgi:cellulose biosynthesis protein BcsQ